MVCHGGTRDALPIVHSSIWCCHPALRVQCLRVSTLGARCEDLCLGQWIFEPHQAREASDRGMWMSRWLVMVTAGAVRKQEVVPRSWQRDAGRGARCGRSAREDTDEHNWMPLMTGRAPHETPACFGPERRGTGPLPVAGPGGCANPQAPPPAAAFVSALAVLRGSQERPGHDTDLTVIRRTRELSSSHGRRADGFVGAGAVAVPLHA